MTGYKMKKNRLKAFVLLLIFALMAYGIYEVSQVDDALEYLFLAEKEDSQTTQKSETTEDTFKLVKTKAQLLMENFESIAQDWTGIIEAYTLTGISQSVGFSSEIGNSLSGQLYAVTKGDQALYHKQLLFGRNFYQEELEKGRRIALIDEQVAISLFRVGDAVGQEVLVNGIAYEVMGVLKHHKRVGDYNDQGVYIPLLTAAADGLPLSYYMVTARPVKGSGAHTVFSNAMKALAPDGTTWDLSREKVGATLFVRVFAFIAGMFVVIAVIKWLNQKVMWFVNDYQTRLFHIYAVRLLPRLIGFGLLFAAAYALMAGLFALLVNFILEPVYVYPEWIPAVLVEWDEISRAFWKVWQQDAQVMELRSAQVLRLRFFALLLQWLTVLAAVFTPTFIRRMLAGKPSKSN